jgi:hypothetical protein
MHYFLLLLDHSLMLELLRSDYAICARQSNATAAQSPRMSGCRQLRRSRRPPDGPAAGWNVSNVFDLLVSAGHIAFREGARPRVRALRPIDGVEINKDTRIMSRQQRARCRRRHPAGHAQTDDSHPERLQLPFIKHHETEIPDTGPGVVPQIGDYQLVRHIVATVAFGFGRCAVLTNGSGIVISLVLGLSGVPVRTIAVVFVIVIIAVPVALAAIAIAGIGERRGR